MHNLKNLAAAAFIGAMSCAVAVPAWADATIHASLWDTGSDSMDGLGEMAPMGMTMAGAADMSMATMGVKVDTDTVAAGEITFDVTNDSADVVHEMLIVPIPDVTAPLPYDEETMRIDEDAAATIGEVPELDPGASGSASFRLAPGTYMLVCNIPGHYVMGMWTLITVTE